MRCASRRAPARPRSAKLLRQEQRRSDALARAKVIRRRRACARRRGACGGDRAGGSRRDRHGRPRGVAASGRVGDAGRPRRRTPPARPPRGGTAAAGLGGRRCRAGLAHGVDGRRAGLLAGARRLCWGCRVSLSLQRRIVARSHTLAPAAARPAARRSTSALIDADPVAAPVREWTPVPVPKPLYLEHQQAPRVPAASRRDRRGAVACGRRGGGTRSRRRPRGARGGAVPGTPRRSGRGHAAQPLRLDGHRRVRVPTAARPRRGAPPSPSGLTPRGREPHHRGDIVFRQHGPLAQLVARLVLIEEVRSSNLLGSTNTVNPPQECGDSHFASRRPRMSDPVVVPVEDGTIRLGQFLKLAAT